MNTVPSHEICVCLGFGLISVPGEVHKPPFSFLPCRRPVPSVSETDGANEYVCVCSEVRPALLSRGPPLISGWPPPLRRAMFKDTILPCFYYLWFGSRTTAPFQFRVNSILCRSPCVFCLCVIVTLKCLRVAVRFELHSFYYRFINSLFGSFDSKTDFSFFQIQNNDDWKLLISKSVVKIMCLYLINDIIDQFLFLRFT